MKKFGSPVFQGGVCALALILTLHCGILPAVQSFTVSYNYDDAGRLIGAEYDDGTRFTYMYDPVGNFTSKSVEKCLHNGAVDEQPGVSAGDAQLAFFIVMGMYDPTYVQECSADCNNDGVISAGDAQQIFGVIFGGSCADPVEKR